MNFDVDIFISYAHIDNLSLKQGDTGWIASFHKALDVRLSQLLGEAPRIWRDKKLQGNDFFGDEIVQQFPNTAMMLSILSPRYIKSEWCIREVKEFYKTASSGVGVRIGNKSRIFKIIKTAVPFEKHPQEIIDTLGYEFYVSDQNTGKTRELEPHAPEKLEQMYWSKLDDIAHDIRDFLLELKEIQGTKTGSFALPSPDQTDETDETALTVYLADTTSDLKTQRDMIRRELTEHGFRVLPDSVHPLVEEDFVSAVQQDLDQSVLACHLVGDSYGLVPEGSRKSTIVLQNELAATKSKTAGLPRLIWLLSDPERQEARQKEFIDLLRSDADTQYGADLFETSIEEFKSAIHETLEEIKNAQSPVTEKFNHIHTIYLAEVIAELQGRRESLRQTLMAAGCRVLPAKPLPLVYGDYVREVDKLLLQSDTAIHLLGDHYGLIPEQYDKSTAYIQNERMVLRCKEGQLDRLVWEAPHIPDHTDTRQKELIDFITTDPDNQVRSQHLESSEDQMETLILTGLKQLDDQRQQASAPQTADTGTDTGQPEQDDGPKIIYLICDKDDYDNEDAMLPQLEDALYDSGFDVVLPIFEGDEKEVTEDHYGNLRTCTAVMIYYGAGNELWLRAIVRDLTKAAGYGREKPLDIKGVFIAPPIDRRKGRFRAHDTVIIKSGDSFDPDSLKPFLDKFK